MSVVVFFSKAMRRLELQWSLAFEGDVLSSESSSGALGDTFPPMGLAERGALFEPGRVFNLFAMEVAQDTVRKALKAVWREHMEVPLPGLRGNAHIADRIAWLHLALGAEKINAGRTD